MGEQRNEHVPPGQREDHPAVKRMKHAKTMKKVKTYCILFLILAGLLGVWVWQWVKSQGKDIRDLHLTDLKDAGARLVSDIKDAGTEIYKGAEEAWERHKDPSDEELAKTLRKKTGAAPTPSPTPSPSTGGTTSPPAATTPPPTPAPAAPTLSPEEEKAQMLVKEANKLYEESYDHHEKYRNTPASDAAARKKEIIAAFDACEKAKKLYQEAQQILGEGSSGWLDDRVQECLQRYQVLKKARGAS